ncbi:helix-turn-helix domain-containing protein [Pseudogemmobacter faecipullorum]|uniref:Cupin domain-containing protein n=1 Tax=Pseudogemmobacter faecipullorum TaxID=2755041 RepID=A0ABS8CNE4_9RHOB|nr:cupin domain-containing protein [Pseudogemmobacter faecipullorum]MCB5410715.1 cupin domain-containing protein [Pseudogemmobacter faecipullorum]
MSDPTPGQRQTTRNSAGTEADEIGLRLRETRLARRLTLGKLSERTGLSIGSLSQIERGLVSPTIRTVYAIAAALEVAPAEIIDPGGARQAGGESPYFLRRAHQPKVLDTNGVIKLLASPSEQDRYKAYVVSIEPGGSSGDDSYAHSGDEIGYVMKGTFSLQIDGHIHLLGEGDCFAFPSGIRHRFFNNGETPAEIIWINSQK